MCSKCGAELPEGALFCPFCGVRISEGNKPAKAKGAPKRRGNGQGSVYKVGKTWTAARVFGYKAEDGGKLTPVRRIKKGFKTKTEAVAYLASLEPPGQKDAGHGGRDRINDQTTVKQMYDLWFPTHKARGKSKSTLDCYQAAMRHFSDIWDLPFSSAIVDDWQDCIDDCGCGRRTKENMRTLVGLLYKYAIPRRGVKDGLNLGEYLFVTGEKGRRHPFTTDELEQIHQNIGTVPYADYIYCHCFLGYRPSEFISRTIEEHYNAEEHCIYGGIKTKAGQTRTVTISPKIQPYIDRIIGNRKAGPIFCRPDGTPFTAERYREVFAEAIAHMGIESTDAHKLTPYSCRHTFASMADKIAGNDNAKLELMGHTDVDMLRHYQHADLSALRKITDAI